MRGEKKRKGIKVHTQRFKDITVDEFELIQLPGGLNSNQIYILLHAYGQVKYEENKEIVLQIVHNQSCCVLANHQTLEVRLKVFVVNDSTDEDLVAVSGSKQFNAQFSANYATPALNNNQTIF